MVKVGQLATLSVVEYPNRTFTGKVTRTAQSLDPSSRTMLTEVQVPNSDSALLPGMYATVQLVLPHRALGDDPWGVPDRSRQWDASGDRH
jgi:multidrug efflux pump subunit AcrA (membrane-fusion protein)